ncbi:hypothetical protein [Erythrobacter sp. THAF29]|uniref:hypothetical protein n=1 Tax=Erythrobacter sp. THAF29 TaxID=2587851 RepID=UPI0012689116|nr:hypothetical protein [Erythrobacter sp. THAF29]
MNTDEFVERARSNLDQIDDELSALEARVKRCGEHADAWVARQAQKLRADVEAARAEVSAIASRVEGDVAMQFEDSKANAERHWEALQAAVIAYREHVGSSL